MEDITIETAKAYEDIARHISHCKESEPVIIFGIRGQRTPGCGRNCAGCSYYSECFPQTAGYVKDQWAKLVIRLLQGELVINES